MGLPTYLFPPDQQALVRVRPAETVNGYNDTVLSYGDAASREAFAGWLQQNNTDQPEGQDGRDLTVEKWFLLTNYADIRHGDRLEWTEHPDGTLTVELDGPPNPVHTPAGFHHLEASWRRIAG